MSQRLLNAATQILKWYDDEDMSNPHSTEMWKSAYNELRDAVTELNERNSVDEVKKVCYCKVERSKVIKYEELGLKCSRCGLPIANF